MERLHRHAVVAALWLGVGALAAQGPAFAKPAVAPLTPGGTVEVRAVIDGETLDLVDGRRVRLVGIDAPRPGTLAGRRLPALAREAKEKLAALLSKGAVELRYAGNQLDRHGRVLAQVFAGGGWVEGALLRAGLARVESFADDRAGVPEMLALERAARRAHRGIWAHPFYAVRRPEEAARYTGSFQIVEGTVVDGARVDGQVFLNFGSDWHTAFTLHLDGAAQRLCRKAGFDPMALVGARLRVRGFIDGTRRPIIDITHPEQIERP
jgi:endonuclease YncB( thermonuclease family)